MGNTFPRPSACFGKDPKKAEKITPVNPSPVELYTEVEQGQVFMTMEGNSDPKTVTINSKGRISFDDIAKVFSDAAGQELKLYTGKDCRVELRQEDRVFRPDKTEQFGQWQTDKAFVYFLVICRKETQLDSPATFNQEQLDAPN